MPAICSVVFGTLLTSAAMLELYVAPNGNDANPGTASAPFASPAHARDVIRARKPNGGVIVSFADGAYRLESPFTLHAADSGTAEAPVVYRASNAGKARIFGGVELPPDRFAKVSNPDVLKRLPENAREAVRAVDLKALGMTDFGTIPDGFEGALPIPELFFNDLRMNLARWPNEGWAEIDSVVESGPAPWRNHASSALGVFKYKEERPARWTTAPTVWLEGYWCFDWACETIRVKSIDPAKREITLAHQHVYGLGSGNAAARRFRAINLLEELDEAGEYFLDRTDGALYFWPPGELNGARIVLSRVTDPLIQLKDVAHIALQGLIMENCAGPGVRVEGGSHVTLAGCTIRNTGQGGVLVNGGEFHTVQSCDVYDTGAGGVSVSGGERKTLQACHHKVDNCHIHHVSRRMRTHANNLDLAGVGITVSHNLIADAPHQGIGVAGNEHVFEFNEVARIGMASDDCGAFYMGRNPSERGTILRNNYWHDIGSAMTHGSCAIYFDDGAGGQLVEGNIFYKAAGGNFGAVFNHGGHDNAVLNNIFIDCSCAVGASPWPAAYWKQWLNEPLWQDKLLREVDITKPPYSDRYPELKDFMHSETQLRMNRAERNIAVRCKNLANGNWEIRDCATLSEDPAFVDEKAKNFQLRDDAQILQRIPGFKKIPFAEIGLYVDAYRPNPHPTE